MERGNESIDAKEDAMEVISLTLDQHFDVLGWLPAQSTRGAACNRIVRTDFSKLACGLLVIW